MNCPCGSNEGYLNCCALAHKDLSYVSTAEQLMRSRYSAFTFANGKYLIDSHHPSTRPLKEQKSLEAWARSVSWIGLEVLDSQKGGINDHTGTVSFNAYFFEKGKMEVIHEKSKFIRENGLWMYLGPAK